MMKTRDRKFLFTIVSLSGLVACSLFTPGDSEPSSSDPVTTQENQTTSTEDTFTPGDSEPSSSDPVATQENQTTPTEETFKMPGGRLLFSIREGDPNITSDFSYEYFMLSLPDNVVEPVPLLTNVDPITGQPVYSPDYSHLAFQRYDRDSQVSSIYLSESENDEAQLISQHANNVFFKDLTWSFNSRFLSFQLEEFSSGGASVLKFWIYDVENGSLNEITFQTDLAQFPELSPNGDQIAFSSQAFGEDQNGNRLSGLYLMNADGTNEHQLVSGQVWDVRWHPDGTRIFFEREETITDQNFNITIISPSQVYSYDLATGLETLMTPSEKPVVLHDFSPDGRFFIYTSKSGIFLISSDGGTPLNVTHLSGGWTWSPDGQYFATTIWIASAESSDIYITDSQGSGRLVKVYSDMYTVIAWLP